MKRIYLLVVFLCVPFLAFGHSGGLDSLGCHKNSKTGDYHCHRNNSTKSQNDTNSTELSLTNEASYNLALSEILSGQTEVSYTYDYSSHDNPRLSANVMIDIVTNQYVIEGGLDKRSSLDSIQQAVFASTLSGKKPAVAIYDTDGLWGKYEQRIWAVAHKLNIKFIWFDGLHIKEPLKFFKN